MFKSLKLISVPGLARQFCYQSDISLRTLHPTSSLKLSTPAVSVSSTQILLLEILTLNVLAALDLQW